MTQEYFKYLFINGFFLPFAALLIFLGRANAYKRNKAKIASVYITAAMIIFATILSFALTGLDIGLANFDCGACNNPLPVLDVIVGVWGIIGIAAIAYTWQLSRKYRI